MYLEGYYAKLNVRQRKINTIWLHLYVESKKNKTNKHNKTKTESQIQNKRVARGEEGGEMREMKVTQSCPTD